MTPQQIEKMVKRMVRMANSKNPHHFMIRQKMAVYPAFSLKLPLVMLQPDAI
jgi:hypothetical protein